MDNIWSRRGIRRGCRARDRPLPSRWTSPLVRSESVPGRDYRLFVTDFQGLPAAGQFLTVPQREVWSCPLPAPTKGPLKPAMQIDSPSTCQMIPSRISQSADRKRRSFFILLSCGTRASFHLTCTMHRLIAMIAISILRKR